MLHIAALRVLGIPLSPLLSDLQIALRGQLGTSPSHAENDWATFPTYRAFQRLASLTILIALPAGIWYASISLTSMTSLTALYNLNAFWAYILSIHYSRSDKWALRPSIAVGIACLGVLVMTAGDSKSEAANTRKDARDTPSEGDRTAASRLLGDLLGLLSSAACGFYEVWYKRYIALPSVADLQLESRPSASQGMPFHATHASRPSYSQLLASNSGNTYDTHSTLNGDTTGGAIRGEVFKIDGDHDIRDANNEDEDGLNPAGHVCPKTNSSLFLFHANSITAAIGICTACLLWIPIPLLHMLGWEVFRLPPDWTTFFAICGVCLCGVSFNAGFMILLSLWGPVVTSVGNLFTLILVAAADEIIALTNGYSALSFSTLAGSGLILASFGMLVNHPVHEEHNGQTPTTKAFPAVVPGCEDEE